jgi:hypothetical protein
MAAFMHCPTIFIDFAGFQSAKLATYPAADFDQMRRRHF